MAPGIPVVNNGAHQKVCLPAPSQKAWTARGVSLRSTGQVDRKGDAKVTIFFLQNVFCCSVRKTPSSKWRVMCCTITTCVFLFSTTLVLSSLQQVTICTFHFPHNSSRRLFYTPCQHGLWNPRVTSWRIAITTHRIIPFVPLLFVRLRTAFRVSASSTPLNSIIMHER